MSPESGYLSISPCSIGMNLDTIVVLKKYPKSKLDQMNRFRLHISKLCSLQDYNHLYWDWYKGRNCRDQCFLG